MNETQVTGNLQEQPLSSGLERVLWVLGLLSLGFNVFAIFAGFHHTIFDFHGFRQAQTAISAEYIMHGGSFLHYETPVFGPPWAVPFEFPLYQWIVAELAKVFSAPLDETGRLVSILFYYLCFFPLASILSRAGLRRALTIPSLSLFALSPIYIFFSRVFMIESTALFFSLMYADQMVRLVLSEKRWQARYIAGAAVFGVLAGLVKVTTLAPFFLLGAGLAAWWMWQERVAGRLKVSVVVAVGSFCVLLPVACTWRWTKFADAQKLKNPFGVYLSSASLSHWNYGTLAQRFNPRSYGHLVRASDNHIGSFIVGFAVVGVYLWLCRSLKRSPWNLVAITAFALYCVGPAIFLNLHLVHEYYPYSDSIFLVVVIGVLISAMLRMPGWGPQAGLTMLLLAMAACGYRYMTHYYPMQHTNAPGRPEAAEQVDEMVGPEGVIMITGLDWSSEFPYQSKRRAIMVPDWKWDGLDPATAQSIANEGAQNIALLVACDDSRNQLKVSVLVHELGMDSPAVLHADKCDLYQRNPAMR